MSETSEMSLDTRRRRAVYRANYRGTKEMDWLLGRFADAKLGEMDADGVAVFEQFLALADPDIQAWLMDTPTRTPVASPDPQFRDLINQIRSFHGLAALAEAGG